MSISENEVERETSQTPKLPAIAVTLLKASSDEIQNLKRANEHMKARLVMFDNVMHLLSLRSSDRSNMMGYEEPVEFRINNFLYSIGEL